MTLPTVTITGNIDAPDNADIGLTVLFRLSAPDIDGFFGVAVPREVRVPVVDGAFSAALWPVSRGVRKTHYTVSVHYPPAVAGLNEIAILGPIRPNESRVSWGLGELLADPSEPVPQVLTRSSWCSTLGGLAGVHGTVAAGLAATAANGYFATATDASRGAQLWRRVNNVAVPVVFEEILL